MVTHRRAAHYERSIPAVVIDALTVTHPAVCTEALRWSTGARGPAVSAEDLQGSDLSAFATQALVVGAQAISVAGSTQDTVNLEALIHDVGKRTSESAAAATQATSQAAADAATAVRGASDELRKTLAEAAEANRRSFGDSVSTAADELKRQLAELLGGDDPQLLQRITPLLEKTAQQMARLSAEQTDTMLTKLTRQFDPADPTSPFAKQVKVLETQQTALASVLERNHLALEGKVQDLTTAVRVATAARAAASAVASVTPIKGASYADEVHRVMHELATEMGDEYADTGTIAGAISRCKKGDGVLTLTGGQTRVVLEMSDSPRSGWHGYLDVAERNRDAAASLGLVRCAEHNGGHAIRVLGPRRIVMAFDPQTDEIDLLRSVVLLLRVGALAANTRHHLDGIQTVRERVGEAVTALRGIDEMTKAATAIHKGADRVSTQADGLRTQLSRLLGQALDALEGVTDEAAGARPDVGSVSGDAA
ncbi:MAG: Fis family transcriptional regulator [Dermatophilaceae bacterium]